MDNNQYADEPGNNKIQEVKMVSLPSRPNLGPGRIHMDNTAALNSASYSNFELCHLNPMVRGSKRKTSLRSSNKKERVGALRERETRARRRHACCTTLLLLERLLRQLPTQTYLRLITQRKDCVTNPKNVCVGD